MDLCIDATAGNGRPAAVARFWAEALGLTVSGAGGEDAKLSPPEGGAPALTVWVNAVPEEIAAKSRVHLDLCLPGGDPAPLLAAGATLVRAADAGRPWHVLEDPDGIALCVFAPTDVPGDGPSELGVYELVVDASDATALATWWADRTGATVHHHPVRPFVWLEGAAGFPFQRWEFNPVPEAKTHKNRIHWDVTLVDADVDALVAAGATLLREPAPDGRWWILADPEGNEFCAFPP
ncbi:MAG: hypothetical protein JWO77_1382 [Ilumatobacteraceae bacterium]|nr:hypothetical protein [Ilumatobacteraceae bacterium]